MRTLKVSCASLDEAVSFPWKRGDFRTTVQYQQETLTIVVSCYQSIVNVPVALTGPYIYTCVLNVLIRSRSRDLVTSKGKYFQNVNASR